MKQVVIVPVVGTPIDRTHMGALSDIRLPGLSGPAVGNSLARGGVASADFDEQPVPRCGPQPLCRYCGVVVADVVPDGADIGTGRAVYAWLGHLGLVMDDVGLPTQNGAVACRSRSCRDALAADAARCCAGAGLCAAGSCEALS